MTLGRAKSKNGVTRLVFPWLWNSQQAVFIDAIPKKKECLRIQVISVHCWFIPFLVYFNPFSVTYMTYQEQFSSRIHLILAIVFVQFYYVILRGSSDFAMKHITEAINSGMKTSVNRTFLENKHKASE